PITSQAKIARQPTAQSSGTIIAAASPRSLTPRAEGKLVARAAVGRAVASTRRVSSIRPDGCLLDDAAVGNRAGDSADEDCGNSATFHRGDNSMTAGSVSPQTRVASSTRCRFDAPSPRIALATIRP